MCKITRKCCCKTKYSECKDYYYIKVIHMQSYDYRYIAIIGLIVATLTFRLSSSIRCVWPVIYIIIVSAFTLLIQMIVIHTVAGCM